MVVGLLYQGRLVGDLVVGFGQLGDGVEKFVVGQIGVQVGCDDFDIQWFGVGGQYCCGLGEYVGVYDYFFYWFVGCVVY